MGLLPHEYYCMSPLEFYYSSKGHISKYYKELEQTRIIAYTTACLKETKQKIKPIHKWMPLPTDKQTGITSDKALKIFEIIKNSKK